MSCQQIILEDLVYTLFEPYKRAFALAVDSEGVQILCHTCELYGWQIIRFRKTVHSKLEVSL